MEIRISKFSIIRPNRKAVISAAGVNDDDREETERTVAGAYNAG
jgi:hypothetical protein